MLKLNLPFGDLESLEQGIELLDEFQWFITIESNDEKTRWAVYGGETHLLSTDSREVVDAFLFGMGLAHAHIPEPYSSEYRKEAKSWTE